MSAKEMLQERMLYLKNYMVHDRTVYCTYPKKDMVLGRMVYLGKDLVQGRMVRLKKGIVQVRLVYL
jgi:hypothetical protein